VTGQAVGTIGTLLGTWGQAVCTMGTLLPTPLLYSSQCLRRGPALLSSSPPALHSCSLGSFVLVLLVSTWRGGSCYLQVSIIQNIMVF
jgi:hypothetical protein